MGEAEVTAGRALLSGEVTFAAQPELPPEAVLRVRVLDTTYADAPALVLSELLVSDVATGANAGRPVAFRVRAEGVNPRSTYTLMAHVSLAGGEKIQPGDYMSTQSYPVITRGHPTHVAVIVERIL